MSLEHVDKIIDKHGFICLGPREMTHENWHVKGEIELPYWYWYDTMFNNKLYGWYVAKPKETEKIWYITMSKFLTL